MTCQNTTAGFLAQDFDWHHRKEFFGSTVG
jgi:hypothetical protein